MMSASIRLSPQKRRFNSPAKAIIDALVKNFDSTLTAKKNLSFGSRRCALRPILYSGAAESVLPPSQSGGFCCDHTEAIVKSTALNTHALLVKNTPLLIVENIHA
jgi:hypothetical protein